MGGIIPAFALLVFVAVVMTEVEAQPRPVTGNTVLVITNPDGIATG
jgi:hypothetical protein